MTILENVYEKHNTLLILTDLVDINSLQEENLLVLRSAYDVCKPSSNCKDIRLRSYDFVLSYLNKDEQITDSNLYLLPLVKIKSIEEAQNKLYWELSLNGRERIIGKMDKFHCLFELYNFSDFTIFSHSPIGLTTLSDLRECISEDDLKPTLEYISRFSQKALK